MTTAARPTTQTVDALGTPIAFERHERGEGGPPVLLLHGGGGISPDAPFVADLARRRRVIVPSHPGYGESERPDWMDTVSDLAHFYLELLEREDLRDVTLVGASLGGWIAAEMAAWRGDRIGRLVLIDPVGIRIGGPTDRDIADLYVMSAEERTARMFRDVAFAPAAPAQLPEDELLRHMRAEEATIVYAWEPYMCNPKLRRRLGSVRTPTLIVWGEHDGLVSPEYGRAYADAIPGARLEVVGDAGHSPHIEQPQRFSEIVESFLSGAPRA